MTPQTTYDNWSQHQLTEREREAFERDGYIVLRQAMDPTYVESLVELSKRLTLQYRDNTGYGPREDNAGSLGATDRMNLKDCAGLDAQLLELLNHETWFPKVAGILGWNIQLYHSQMVIAPPDKDNNDNNRPGWHRDSARLNAELEVDPEPRISLKAGIHLSDALTPECGNMWVVPGSHLWAKGKKPSPDDVRGVPVLAAAGDVVLFDRRLWHRGGENFSDHTRRIIFYGYSYRWLRPRSDLKIAPHLIDTLTPLQHQLMATDNPRISATSPQDNEVPLKGVMASMPSLAAV